jgi:hypothetical protein
MSDFGEYYTDEQSDGTWICAAHYDNDVAVKGDTEAKALQNMILALHHVNGVHCNQYLKYEPDLKAIKKTRALLAEHSEMIESAREFAAIYAFPANPWAVLVGLADSLEADDE